MINKTLYNITTYRSDRPTRSPLELTLEEEEDRNKILNSNKNEIKKCKVSVFKWW